MNNLPNKHGEEKTNGRNRRQSGHDQSLSRWPLSSTEGPWDTAPALVFSVMGSTIGPMLKNADDLMYEVKKHGKNNMKVVEQGSGL